MSTSGTSPWGIERFSRSSPRLSDLDEAGELLAASFSDCERITSYLDGYFANAIFGHLRVAERPSDVLPATIELPEGQRAIDLATADHPFS
jgi:hypothetical protein